MGKIRLLLNRTRQSQLKTKEGEKEGYLTLVKVVKIVTSQQLAEVRGEESSLTPGDIQNVIRNLMTAMRKELLNSRSVRLEGLGTFTMKACTQGHGVDQEEEVSPNQVAALRCLFTPEYTRPAAIGTTRALLQGVEFQKVSAIGGAINGGSGSGDIVDDPTA